MSKKTKILWIIVLLYLILFGIAKHAYSADFYILGFNGKWIKDAKWHHVFAGAVVSWIVHELGHIVVLEAYDLPYNYKFPDDYEYEYTDNVCDGEHQMIARAGFFAQHTVNLGLTTFKKKSDFTKGYTIATSILTLSYPFRQDSMSDFNSIDKHGGNSNIEFAIFSCFSFHNIFRIEW